MTATDHLFELGRRTLQALRADLAQHRIAIAPDLELRPGTNALSYYNTQDGHIYLSTPDPHAPRGKFQFLLFRSVTQLGSDAEVYRLLELLIPWLIAHEIGHHLRHKSGRLSTDVWREERIANQVAGALIKPKLAAREREELLALLARAIGNVAAGLERHHPAGVSPHNIIAYRTNDTDAYRAEEHPRHDPIGYILLHMRWLYGDLIAQETPKLERLARHHLQPLPATARNREGGEARPS